MSTATTSPSTPVSDTSSLPSPKPSALEELKAELSYKMGEDVFKHCLGLAKLEGVSKLADSMIVVCFDTESWTHDHSKLTEIGVATFDSRDMKALDGLDMHGESLLKQVYFYHARIEENAHLVNIKYCVGDPESNRFGQTRFVDEKDTCEMLDSIFRWPVDHARPELGFCPVVALGHSLKDDFQILSRTLGVHAATFDTVVKTIDTQHLCKETSFYTSRNQAGLSTLVSSANFSYRDPHTACNDAAMTLICAVQMVLPAELKFSPYDNIPAGARSLQDVVDDVEVASGYQEWSWGTVKYCLRCTRRGHTAENNNGRRCRAKIECAHCASSKDVKRQKAKWGHVTKKCIFFALRGAEVEDGVDHITGRVGAISIDY